jgi:hypothetical protein
MHGMAAQHWYPFDLISRVFAERLQGCAASDELRALVRSQAVDWEAMVGHASKQFVLTAFAAALQDLGLTG